ncbi:hypothetical protein ACUHMQ_05730 [Chitinimonas sp. PSY-7]|uniref:hypothetical protein n=1 Tax=Chitinimonas sp. PSY-7 TaxID=3459088 RepID=UPI00403FE8B1
MTEYPITTWLRSLENSLQASQSLYAGLAALCQPTATDLKQGLKACMDSGQRVSDWQQTQQQSAWSAFCSNGDMPALINYCQQYSDTDHQLRHELLNWQMQIPMLMQQQLYSFLNNCLDVRSSGDGMLAFIALQESATQQWKAHYEALQQLISSAPPAYMAGLQQYLQFAEAPGPSQAVH